MFEEALKWVGPYPLIQLLGSIALLAIGIRAALAGKAAAPTVSAPPPVTPHVCELPDWFVREHREGIDLLKRVSYMIEDIRNHGE